MKPKRLCGSCTIGMSRSSTLTPMFTGKPQKNRGAATTYFDEHLTQNDYYSQDVTMGQQAGQWIGLGVERLGLKQGEVVSREAFLR